ncbi:dihydrofolate reductase [Kickxella alabastrina]|nr:dihydrofolate reductase [Kickxella alabastrina]
MLTLVVAAAALNNGIGVNNDLPWRLPTDLAYFNNVTRTTTSTTAINACIMGRRTWLSIPRRFRPLDNRYNIVITRDTHLLDKELPPNSIALPSIASALAHIEQINSGQVPLDGGLLRIDKVFVCGGRAIYEEAMGMPGGVRVLLTSVHYDGAGRCDTFFPPIDQAVFVPQTHASLEKLVGFPVPAGVQTENGISFEFLLFEKQA